MSRLGLRHVTPDELWSLTLGQRIRYMCDEYATGTGDKQAAFARLIGVTRETVNRWVGDRGSPRREHAERIAALGGYDPALFEKEDPMEFVGRQLAELRALIGTGRAERHHEHHDLQEQVTAQSALLRELVDAASDLAREIARLRESGADGPKRRRATG